MDHHAYPGLKAGRAGGFKMLSMKNYTLLLYCKDIQLLTGRKEKYARGIIKQVWAEKKLPRQRWITIADFCRKFGLTEEILLTRLALLNARLE